MKEKIWTTKIGEEIKYKDLEDGHLLNIIRYVKRRAKELDGEVIAGVGHGSDDIWYEVGYEEDWLNKFHYSDLLKEAKNRNLITNLKEL